MYYISECSHRCSSFFDWITTPTTIAQLKPEQRKILDHLWPQVEANNCPLNKEKLASAISLMDRVAPGHYSKGEVSKMTNGVLKCAVVFSEAKELYMVPQKEGKLLGVGAAKKAYEGYQITPVKVETVAYLTVKRDIEESENEGRLSKIINSPYVMGQNLSETRYVGKAKQNKLFMAQEKMEGTLEDLLESSDLTTKQRLAVLLSIANGLKDMHAKEISHRDLHKGNIFYRWDRDKLEVKIADLGRAKENTPLMGIQSDLLHLANHITAAFYRQNGEIREGIDPSLGQKLEGIRDGLLDKIDNDPHYQLAEELVLQLEELLIQAG